MQSVAVTRCVSVTGGHADNTPWVISNFESINGVEYIPLSMRDSGFHRFVAGAGSRGICGKSGDFLTKLRELRATATQCRQVRERCLVYTDSCSYQEATVDVERGFQAGGATCNR